MITNRLDDAHHVVRHIRTRWMDVVDGKVVIIPQAFQLTEKDEGYLSAGWLEHCEGTSAVRLRSVLTCLKATLKIKGTEGLSTGNVGRIKSCCGKYGKKVRLMHEPYDANPSYVAVRQYQDDNLEMLMQLATADWADLKIVSEIEAEP